MFDPDDDDKAAKMLRLKEEALAKSKLPPLGGRHSKSPAEQIPLGNLMLEPELWRYTLENFKLAQDNCGLETRKGIWVLVDKAKAESLKEPYKTFLREFLNEKRKLGKFKVEDKCNQQKSES